jgi:hypothetical protein
MFEITVNDLTPHLEVTVNGNITPQVMESFLEEAAQTSAELGIYSYLVDLRQAGKTDLQNRYHAVACKACELGFKPGSKLAIVTREDCWQEYLSLEMFVATHGYYCKIFLERNDALGWLW